MFSWQNPSQTFYFSVTCDWFRNMHTSVESQWPICPLNSIFGGECNYKCGSAGQCVREGNAILIHGSDVHPTTIPVTQVFVHPGLHHWLEYASSSSEGIRNFTCSFSFHEIDSHVILKRFSYPVWNWEPVQGQVLFGISWSWKRKWTFEKRIGF